MMANFMCQLDWAMGCPDIQSNTILGVSVPVFLDEINIGIRRLNKADCPPQSVCVCGRGDDDSSNPLKT